MLTEKYYDDKTNQDDNPDNIIQIEDDNDELIFEKDPHDRGMENNNNFLMLGREARSNSTIQRDKVGRLFSSMNSGVTLISFYKVEYLFGIIIIIQSMMRI
jgi:hypothetical protein